MVGLGTLILATVAGVASLFMAWTIGAGSSGSTPFAPAVSAQALSTMRAAFLVGLFAFLGAVVQGTSVAEAMAAGLIHDVSLTPVAVVIALFVAAALVAIGVFTGYPIATSFTATGAVIGVGLALGGGPAWSKYQQIGLLWLLTPFLGGGAAYLTTRLLRKETVPNEYSIPILGGIITGIIVNIPFTFLGSSAEGASVVGWLTRNVSLAPLFGISLFSAVFIVLSAGWLYLALREDSANAQRKFLFILGAIVAFSAGGSQVGLAIGPVLPLYTSLTIPAVAVLIGGGLGLLLGSWMGAPRMIKAIPRDYAALGPRRAMAALIPSFAIAQVAILYGIPMSFNEIVVSAVIGSGFAAGEARVNRGKLIYTALAWVGSLVLSLVVSYAVFSVLG
ncbi:anion permease [Haladaptatus sp. CMAA 1911]|uniref:inorganic phosphate transporter n=1 Tax=unclassified Haladaptatus TaxID=2622732 RepID=UPI003753F838